ncbi:MAG: hypothetical protein GX334_03140 [Firmicutes bacterium]|nr:hypothetical protein [Bacillota bacterium]
MQQKASGRLYLQAGPKGPASLHGVFNFAEVRLFAPENEYSPSAGDVHSMFFIRLFYVFMLFWHWRYTFDSVFLSKPIMPNIVQAPAIQFFYSLDSPSG